MRRVEGDMAFHYFECELIIARWEQNPRVACSADEGEWKQVNGEGEG